MNNIKSYKKPREGDQFNKLKKNWLKRAPGLFPLQQKFTENLKIRFIISKFEKGFKKYSGDPNTEHSNTRNIWLTNILKVGCQMNHSKTELKWSVMNGNGRPFEIRTPF